MENPFNRSVLFGFLASVLAVQLSGCHTVREDWASVSERPAPQVSTVYQVHSIVFAGTSDQFTGDERKRLDTFLSRIDLASEDEVFLLVGNADEKLRNRRRSIVSAYLAHKDVAHETGVAGTGLHPPAPDTISIAVRQILVTLPSCPDWSGKPEDNWNNMPATNWGCATAVNLGLMIANPHDLIAGRDPGPADGVAATAAIRRYRAGKTKSLETESASGGDS